MDFSSAPGFVGVPSVQKAGSSPRLQSKSFSLISNAWSLRCSAFAHWQERHLWPLLLKNLRAKL